MSKLELLEGTGLDNSVCMMYTKCFALFQTPAYCIEYETRHYQADLHVRFHSSNTGSATINTYLWPALLEGASGPCVQKGVVIT